jgi:hypothetical protein
MNATTRYELPPGGISLLGYVVRRMHKTSLLVEALDRLDRKDPAEALIRVALFAAAASASYGPAYYQPRFNRPGDRAVEADPATGALVEAVLVSAEPHTTLESVVRLDRRASFTARETIEGTTIGLRGLGMPAPSLFEFATDDRRYLAHLAGTITNELVPALLRPTRIRAYGELSLGDSAGHAGRLTLDRDGVAHLEIARDGQTWQRRFDLTADDLAVPAAGGLEVEVEAELEEDT